MDFADNIILLSDSYKVTHYRQYPPGTQQVYSYFESRGCDRDGWDECCFFGLQYFLKRYLCGQVVTREKIDEAETIYAQHFGNDALFYKEGWEYILTQHEGRLPIKIKALPEGTVIPLKTVLMTVVNTDPNCFWLTNFLETLLVQVWYPMTVATNSRYQKISIQQYLEATGCEDFAPPNGAAFKLHDFGFRGVSSVESAATGGMAHLVNFLGTDTIAGVVAACRYYGAQEAMGFSIPASEHSTISSWGVDGEVEAMRNMLEQYPSGLVACVSDTFNIFKACEEYWGGELKDLIKGRITDTSFGRLVVRPDSGDPTETCCAVISILCEQFAEDVQVTATGHKLLPPYIRVIQGDGVDYKTIPKILQALMDQGFAADNIAFGSGGALLQKVNRDTLKMAFKCSDIVIDGQAREVFKDPITDNGKASKKGRLTLQYAEDFQPYAEEDVYTVRDGPDGIKGGTGFLHFTPCGRFVTVASGMGDEGRDLMVDVYENGDLLVDWSLTEIRQRADIPNGPFTLGQPVEADEQQMLLEQQRDLQEQVLQEQQQAEAGSPAQQAFEQEVLRGQTEAGSPAQQAFEQEQMLLGQQRDLQEQQLQQQAEAGSQRSSPAQQVFAQEAAAVTVTAIAQPAMVQPASSEVIMQPQLPAGAVIAAEPVSASALSPTTTSITPQAISTSAVTSIAPMQQVTGMPPATITRAPPALTMSAPVTQFAVSAVSPTARAAGQMTFVSRAPQVTINSTPFSQTGSAQAVQVVQAGSVPALYAGQQYSRPAPATSPVTAYKPYGAQGQLVTSTVPQAQQFVRAQAPSFVAAPPGAVIRTPSFVAAPQAPQQMTMAPQEPAIASAQTMPVQPCAQLQAMQQLQAAPPQFAQVATTMPPGMQLQPMLTQSVRAMPGAMLAPGIRSGVFPQGSRSVTLVGGPSPRNAMA